MYDQSKLSELIRFARVDAGSTVIDVCLSFSRRDVPDGSNHSMLWAVQCAARHLSIAELRALFR
jgi:hypothetical protein